MTAQRSPLHDRHAGLGAKWADFGGWTMPVEYPGSGGGVLAEHHAVRTAVGLFDVSHLGKATVSGPGAAVFLNSCLTNDLDRIGPGQAQYTLCCDDASGGVVDDLIAYLRGPDEVFLVPNAANTAEVVRRLRAAAPGAIAVTEQHADFAVLAVQGPRSDDVLAAIGLPADHDYMSFTETRWQSAGLAGADVIVCRTGYTGEHGYELIAPSTAAPALWDAVLQAGARYGIRPAGLGARDTLRTEMGYPLHGQDLSLDITPNQARSGWAVGWDKPEFWGRSVLLAEKEAGPARLLWGLRATGRGVIRSHLPVIDGAGAVVGETTTGTFSPSLRVGIGLALLDRGVGITNGTGLAVDVRGRPLEVTVVKPPFVESHVR
ncbi:MAG: glycine cleavage system aminomethyltransferase GcvT [Geodermatophilaceae bacterium]|nr:glycine cleavage system aminomethyltransferase GcvT [Geodermatophilaceae bacterium]